MFPSGKSPGGPQRRKVGGAAFVSSTDIPSGNRRGRRTIVAGSTPPVGRGTCAGLRPIPHPRLSNGRTGDPALHVETLHRPDAVLLDCGDLSALSPRHLPRVGALAVSHAHMDYWAGFDRLLRLPVERDKRLPVVGPQGFAERLFHRLQAYTWNLAGRIPADLAFEVPRWPRSGHSRAPGCGCTAASGSKPYPRSRPGRTAPSCARGRCGCARRCWTTAPPASASRWRRGRT